MFIGELVGLGFLVVVFVWYAWTRVLICCFSSCFAEPAPIVTCFGDAKKNRQKVATNTINIPHAPQMIIIFVAPCGVFYKIYYIYI